MRIGWRKGRLETGGFRSKGWSAADLGLPLAGAVGSISPVAVGFDASFQPRDSHKAGRELFRWRKRSP